MLLMNATCTHSKVLMRLDAMRRFVSVLGTLLIHGRPILRAYLILLTLSLLSIVVHLAKLRQLLMSGLIPECSLPGAESFNGSNFERLIRLLQEVLTLPRHERHKIVSSPAHRDGLVVLKTILSFMPLLGGCVLLIPLDD